MKNEEAYNRATEGFSKEFDEYFLTKNSEQKGRWRFADIFSLAHHFYEIGCRTAEKHENEYNWQRAEEEIPNDFEEAAGEYEKTHTYQRYDGGGLTPEYDATLAETFIAGAEWQKEQMMKEAVEGEVVKDISNKLAVTAKNVNLDKFKFGDKVRIIILPKEDGQ